MRKERILVWDLPTRFMHWGMALSFVGAYLTAESERYRDIHVMLGYTLLGLILCRVVWGLVGTRYARFKSFLYGPRAVTAYLYGLLRGKPRHYVGHNPAGSVAIYLLLAVGLLAAGTGYATYNDSGGDWLGELHEGVAGFMLGLVFVHIAGVVVSSWIHRENLVRSMITGRKTGERREGIRHAHAWLALVLAAAITVFWYQGSGNGIAAGLERASRLAQGELQHTKNHHDD